jgi:probable addiction module antidote protein
MSTRTIPRGRASTLNDKLDIAEYLNAAVEKAIAEDDFSYVTHAIGVIARAKGMSELAREIGVGRESLYRSLSSDGNPSFATVARVLRTMGVSMQFARI